MSQVCSVVNSENFRQRKNQWGNEKPSNAYWVWFPRDRNTGSSERCSL